MSIVKLLFLIATSVVIVACATGNGETYQLANETTTHKGFRYLVGRGVKQDRAQAVQYFQQAANEGDAFAQNELGYLYAAGKGVPQNYSKAFHWYNLAAKHGLASAQYNLGLLYLHGLGTSADQTKGYEWIQKAASNGFEPARQAIAERA